MHTNTRLRVFWRLCNHDLRAGIKGGGPGPEMINHVPANDGYMYIQTFKTPSSDTMHTHSKALS